MYRNPDGAHSMWCVVMDEDVLDWEYCMIPHCGAG